MVRALVENADEVWWRHFLLDVHSTRLEVNSEILWSLSVGRLGTTERDVICQVPPTVDRYLWGRVTMLIDEVATASRTTWVVQVYSRSLWAATWKRRTGSDRG